MGKKSKRGNEWLDIANLFGREHLKKAPKRFKVCLVICDTKTAKVDMHFGCCMICARHTLEIGDRLLEGALEEKGVVASTPKNQLN